jgi:hypothetical protein
MYFGSTKEVLWEQEKKLEKTTQAEVKRLVPSRQSGPDRGPRKCTFRESPHQGQLFKIPGNAIPFKTPGNALPAGPQIDINHNPVKSPNEPPLFPANENSKLNRKGFASLRAGKIFWRTLPGKLPNF